MTTKRDILEAAIVATADRGLNYGSPEDNFTRIARRWQVHFRNRHDLEVPVDAHDVAMMMADLKLARLENKPDHADSWVDLAGYAACGGSMQPPPDKSRAQSGPVSIDDVVADTLAAEEIARAQFRRAK